MSRNLEARVAKLEEALAADLAVLIWGDHAGGPLKGYKVGGQLDPRIVSRLPGESDEALKLRAIARDGEGRLPHDPVRFLWECRG